MVNSYDYLLCVLILLVVAGVFLWFAGAHRKIAVIAGIFYICVLPLYIPFEQEYWSPVRLGGWLIGFEDALLLFACGSGPWAAVGTILRNRLTTHLVWRNFLWRYGCLAFLGISIFLSIWLLGLPAILASVAAQLVISILVLVLRPDLLPLAFISFIVWMPSYFAVLKVSYWLMPEFKGIWNLNDFWGTTLAGLPIGEILWMASGVWGYPVAIGFVTNAQISGTKSCCTYAEITESSR